MDLGRLTDARRVARMAFVLDELRKMMKTRNTIESITTAEFKMCGGIGSKKKYSFYRQLVLAKRDAIAFTQRGIVPCKQAVSNANKMFVFHDSDDEAVVDDGSMVGGDAFALARIATILRIARKAMRDSGSKTVLDAINMSVDDFVRCGGHKTALKLKTPKRYSFQRQLICAKRDMQRFVERKRLPRTFKERFDHHIGISDDEEEENVDGLDGYVSSEGLDTNDIDDAEDGEEDDYGDDDDDELDSPS